MKTAEELKHTHYGMWASLRRDYLDREHPQEWAKMVASGDAEQYLKDYQEAMWEKSEKIEEKLQKEMGLTEELKRRDSMGWVGLANNIRSMVYEIMRKEIEA